MKPAELAALIDTLAAGTPRLREVGVLELEVGDLRVVIAPSAPAPLELEDGDEDDDEPAFTDPLNDPATYGRARGVPGFPRDEDD